MAKEIARKERMKLKQNVELDVCIYCNRHLCSVKVHIH